MKTKSWFSYKICGDMVLTKSNSENYYHELNFEWILGMAHIADEQKHLQKDEWWGMMRIIRDELIEKGLVGEK